MKKLIPIILIFIACGNNENVVISKDEYYKLTGDTISHKYPKKFKLNGGYANNLHIVLGSDGHEYIENMERYMYVLLHTPECIKCKSSDTLKTKQ
jgi:hypothetical protein